MFAQNGHQHIKPFNSKNKKNICKFNILFEGNGEKKKIIFFHTAVKLVYFLLLKLFEE